MVTVAFKLVAFYFPKLVTLVRPIETDLLDGVFRY
jgi:hypothetical protein